MKKLFVLTAYAEAKGGGGKSGEQSANQATTSFTNV